MHYSNFASLRISWRSVRFDQDVELVLTGKLIVEISLGGPAAAGRTSCSRADQLQQGGPAAATLHGPAGLLEAR